MKLTFKAIILSILIAGFSSCGSSGTSNDQGVSFTLYGFFSDAKCEEGLLGLVLPLSSDIESNFSGAGAQAALGLQNNLAQSIRTRRVFMNYYIEGASVQPPSTSQPLGLFMQPGTVINNNVLLDNIKNGGTSTDDEEGDGGTVVTNVTSTACGQFLIVPSEIVSYLSFNRDTLPELPYKMRVEVTVSGIGSAGDEYITNPLDFFVQVTEDNLIVPTAADEATDDAAALEEAIVDDSGQNTEIIPIEDVE